MSEFTRETLKSFLNPKNLSIKKFQESLTNKFEEIKMVKIPSNEKEFLLSMSAIAYFNNSITGRKNVDCYLETAAGTATVPCYMAGAFVGAAIRLFACGPGVHWVELFLVLLLVLFPDHLITDQAV